MVKKLIGKIALMEYFSNEREQKRAVSYKKLKTEAERLTNEIFTISWNRRFAKRNNLSIRRVTHAEQKTTKCQEKKTEILMEYIKNLNCLAINYDECVIINMDETPFYLDSVPHTTLENIGTRQIDILTTGNDKNRMSLALSIVASGEMLKSFVILKNFKNVPKVSILNNVYVVTGGVGSSGFMTERLMLKYIDNILPYLKGRKCLLIMDKLKAHNTKLVVDYLKKHNIQIFLIEAGMTSELQPLDVSIDGPLKTAFRELWERWTTDYECVFTKQGNSKKPAYDVCFQMISEAMKKINQREIIKHSFISSGFNCFHHIQKHPDGNLSLTFNDRLKANFFNVSNLNERLLETLPETKITRTTTVTSITTIEIVETTETMYQNNSSSSITITPVSMVQDKLDMLHLDEKEAEKHNIFFF